MVSFTAVAIRPFSDWFCPGNKIRLEGGTKIKNSYNWQDWQSKDMPICKLHPDPTCCKITCSWAISLEFNIYEQKDCNIELTSVGTLETNSCKDCHAGQIWNSGYKPGKSFITYRFHLVGVSHRCQCEYAIPCHALLPGDLITLSGSELSSTFGIHQAIIF